MKLKSIFAALLLMVAGLQNLCAQERGMKVWRNGSFVGYYVSNVDSIQFVILATDVVLSQSDVSLEIGDSVKLTATVYPEDASKVLRWTSSNPGIASVSENGMVTAISNGTCVITCRAVDGKDVSVECFVKVGRDMEPVGDGTQASPYNVAAIVAKIRTMEPDVESSEEYYIKGKVLNVLTDSVTIAQYGNYTFEMVDEGYNFTIFRAFQVYGPGKKKFTSFDAVKVGDEVVVCGKVVNYRGTYPETVGRGAAYVVSINGEGGDDTPVGDDTSITCAEAVQLTSALADGATSTETYTITGYITEVIGNVSRNQQSFWMADTKDGGKIFEAYWANLPEGVTEFKAGMKVKITGYLMKYVKNGVITPEIKNATVIILENGDDGDNPDPGTDPSGDPVTDIVNGDFESWVSDTEPTGWKSASTASNAELGKNTEAHGGSFACVIKAPGTTNKRLATQEITLEAGSYTFSFYAKSTTADISQSRAGYVPVNADGSVGTYKYGVFVNLSNTEWTQISFDIELTEQTTLCLIVMNPKNSSYSVSQDILIDDATLTKK